MMQQETEPKGMAMALPDAQTTHSQLAAVREFQKIVRAALIQGLDYGIIPGTEKPTLYKPGAEKMTKLLALADEYDILSEMEDWDKPLFAYKVRCRLVHLGNRTVVSTGLGECNTMEAKYRWREAKRCCPSCRASTIIKGKAEYGGGWLCFKKLGGCGAKFGEADTAITSQPTGRVLNEDIFSQVNTVLKMAKKRALVDAALSAGRLSDIFTQDMEDFADTVEVESQVVEDSPPAQAQRPAAPTRATPPTPAPSGAGQAPPVPSGGATRQEDDLFGGQKPAAQQRQWQPEDIKTTSDFLRACFDLWGLQPAQAAANAGYGNPRDIPDRESRHAFEQVLALKKGA